MAGYRELTAPADRQAAACLDAETLSALAGGELDAASRDRALDHIVDCSDCATELRLAKEIRAWSETSSDQKGAGRRETFRPAWATLAAAMLAIVVGSWWWLGDPSSTPDRPALRQAGTDLRTVQPADGSALETVPRRIQWQSVPGAQAYRAQVLDATGHEVWRSPWVEVTEVEPAWGAVPPGTFLWTVEVRGPVSRKRLGPFSFSTTSVFKPEEASAPALAPEPEPAAEPRAQ